MAQSGANGHTPGDMDIQEQKSTFGSFMSATVWFCIFLAQGLALAVLAFAIGAGWWSGWLAFVAIGVVAGLFFRMSGIFWAVEVLFWVLLAIGGMIVPLIAGAAG